MPLSCPEPCWVVFWYFLYIRASAQKHGGPGAWTELRPCIPAKRSDYALVWPGDRSTYGFASRSSHDTRAYHEDLRQVGSLRTAGWLVCLPWQTPQAWFALTRPKGGWDCLRHYEILAAGTLPYFLDLSRPGPTSVHPCFCWAASLKNAPFLRTGRRDRKSPSCRPTCCATGPKVGGRLLDLRHVSVCVCV